MPDCRTCVQSSHQAIAGALNASGIRRSRHRGCRRGSFRNLAQHLAAMGGYVVGLVALDLVLRIVGAGAMGVALVVEVADVDLGDHAADMAGLRVPADM